MRTHREKSMFHMLLLIKVMCSQMMILAYK